MTIKWVKTRIRGVVYERARAGPRPPTENDMFFGVQERRPSHHGKGRMGGPKGITQRLLLASEANGCRGIRHGETPKDRESPRFSEMFKVI